MWTLSKQPVTVGCVLLPPASFTLSLKRRRESPGQSTGMEKQPPPLLAWAPFMRCAPSRPGHESKGGLLQPPPFCCNRAPRPCQGSKSANTEGPLLGVPSVLMTCICLFWGQRGVSSWFQDVSLGFLNQTQRFPHSTVRFSSTEAALEWLMGWTWGANCQGSSLSSGTFYTLLTKLSLILLACKMQIMIIKLIPTS